VDRMCSSIREFGFKIFGSERRHCEFSFRSDCGRHMDCSSAPEKRRTCRAIRRRLRSPRVIRQVHTVIRALMPRIRPNKSVPVRRERKVIRYLPTDLQFLTPKGPERRLQIGRKREEDV
jgi:hypothetical protein